MIITSYRDIVVYECSPRAADKMSVQESWMQLQCSIQDGGLYPDLRVDRNSVSDGGCQW